MIKFFKDWIRELKESADIAAYDRGYEFAAGILLCSMGTADPRDNIDGNGPFDSGIRDATDHFQALVHFPVGYGE